MELQGHRHRSHPSVAVTGMVVLICDKPEPMTDIAVNPIGNTGTGMSEIRSQPSTDQGTEAKLLQMA